MRSNQAIKICFACLLISPLWQGTTLGGQSLDKLQQEIKKIIDSTQVSVVTVASRFSHEYYVEKESSILSFFKTEREKKSLTYINIGTGFLIDDRGHILTRSSNVLDALSTTVTLASGREYQASLIGHDPQTGFAILKIEARDIHPAKLGNSDKIGLGSWVLVIGNSLGVFPSVMLGMINGLRSDGLIQISANIDPGNNGSPVINTHGEIIGIVAARLNPPGASSTEVLYNARSSESVLVYPINWIQKIARDIIQYGHVRKAWLGVVGYQSGLRPEIKQVIPNSPAEKVGLKVGDVIIKYSGKNVRNVAELARLVEYSSPGEKVVLEFLRNGEPSTVEVELGEKAPESSVENDFWTQPSIISTTSTLTPDHVLPVDLMRMNKKLEKRIHYLEEEVLKLKKQLEAN